MTYYMHTLDGKPAEFDGYQICFAMFCGKPSRLCVDLRQIRREQQASNRNRTCDGLMDDMEYGHLRVAAPEPTLAGEEVGNG